MTDVSPLVILRVLRVVVDENPDKRFDPETTGAALYREKQRGKYVPVCVWGHTLYRIYGQRVLATLQEGMSIDFHLARLLELPVDRGSKKPLLHLYSEEMRKFLFFAMSVQHGQDSGDTWETAWADALLAHYEGEYPLAVKELRRKRVWNVLVQGQGNGGAGPQAGSLGVPAE